MVLEQQICSEAEKLKKEMARTLMELVRIPAIAPENGGEGESEKAEKLMKLLQTIGFDKIERHDSPDERVPSKKRPNIVAYYNVVDTEERLWIITHMDIVPPGEETLWKVTPPFSPVIKDGKIYGRGAEDNMQSMMASIFAVKALKNLKANPKRSIAIALVADEEQGSKHGIQYLIKKGLFRKSDLVVVPDSGNENGSFIEIAEKSSIWFRIRTIGQQAHASRPDKGLNAHRIGMQYATALDKLLHERYPEEDKTFDPPESTIEPTKKEKNVDAINIVPGEDLIYFDCRILPSVDMKTVLNDINALAREFEEKTRAKINIEVISQSVAPRPTDSNARIVSMLKQAIRKMGKVQPTAGGIGGGTCAAFFRRKGMPAAVWSTIDETAHQPDEYSKIENMISDTKVFALLATTQLSTRLPEKLQ
jgi:succinyl-diaminopimelate desuccinylase